MSSLLLLIIGSPPNRPPVRTWVILLIRRLGAVVMIPCAVTLTIPPLESVRIPEVMALLLNIITAELALAGIAWDLQAVTDPRILLLSMKLMSSLLLPIMGRSEMPRWTNLCIIRATLLSLR